jgi:hypothetical protein
LQVITRNIKSNGTITWTKISENLAGKNTENMSLLEQSPANVNMLFAARGDGKVFRTENLLDASVTWVDITASLPGGGSPSDIECHPYEPLTVYMTLNQKIYKSINKGGTWQNISGTLPSIGMSSIAFDKSSNEGLYLGTDAGVYYKDAGMSDWVLYGEALPVSVGVSELEIYQDPRNRADSRLRACTFGRGVWEIKLAETSTNLAPAMLTADVAGSSIDLNWVPPFYEGNIQGYRVYRNGSLLTLVNGLSYSDSNIETDVTYTYAVSALYNSAIESGLTNEAFATIITDIELPYSQQFERGTAGWTAKYSLEGWKYGTAETLAVTGREGHFFAANSSAAGEGVIVKDYLVTPPIDLSSFTGKTITLKFAYTMRKYRTYDKFSAVYRVSPDSAWVKLADLTPPSKNDWVWDTTQFNLPEKALKATTQIGFYYDNSNQFAWGAAVDDVDLFVNTTSAKSTGNLTGIRVYPNPNHGQFNLEIVSGISGDIKVQLFNIAGQVVLEKNIQNNSGTLVEMIDISTQPKGVYQLTVRSKIAEWRQKITIQ